MDSSTGAIRLVGAVSERLHIYIISIDFSKAFDKMNHFLLLLKLDDVYFGDRVLPWCDSFLGGNFFYLKLTSLC